MKWRAGLMGKQNDVPLSSQTGHGRSPPKTVCRLRCSSLLCWRTRSSCPETHRQRGGLASTSPRARRAERRELTMRTALSMSQSAKMMRGDFPPSSRETFFTLLTAQLQKQGEKRSMKMKMFCLNGLPFRWSLTSSWCVFQFQWSLWSPVYVHLGGRTDAVPPEHLEGEYDDIKFFKSHRVIIHAVGSCHLNSFLPDPGRMLMTPLGSPALAANSANFSAVSGVTWKHTQDLFSQLEHRVGLLQRKIHFYDH